MFTIPTDKTFVKPRIYNGSFYSVVDNKLHEFVDYRYSVLIKFNADGGYWEHECVFIGYKTNDTEGVQLDPRSLYASAKSFEQGHRLNCSEEKLYEFVGGQKKMVGIYSKDTTTFSPFTYDKEEMIAKPFTPSRIILVFTREEFEEYVDGVNLKFMELYSDEQQVYKDNPYRKVDADGTEHIIYPEYYKIRPTEEQMVIIKQIEELFQKAKNANIKLLLDNEDSCLCAFNNEGIRAWGYEPEHGCDSDDDAIAEGLLIYRDEISTKHCYVINGDMDYLGCEDAISIKSDEYIKEEEAQKAK